MVKSQPTKIRAIAQKFTTIQCMVSPALGAIDATQGVAADVKIDMFFGRKRQHISDTNI